MNWLALVTVFLSQFPSQRTFSNWLEETMARRDITTAGRSSRKFTYESIQSIYHVLYALPLCWIVEKSCSFSNERSTLWHSWILQAETTTRLSWWAAQCMYSAIGACCCTRAEQPDLNNAMLEAPLLHCPCKLEGRKPQVLRKWRIALVSSLPVILSTSTKSRNTSFMLEAWT